MQKSPGVRFYQDKDYTSWNNYISSNENTTVYHSIEWRDIVKAEYGFKDLYVLAESNGEIQGVLPMFLVSNFTGRKIISLPVSMYGGPVADNEIIFRKLAGKASDIAVKRGAYLQFVTHEDVGLNGFSRINIEMDSVLSLDFSDLDAFYNNLSSSSVRYSIRKAEKGNVIVKFGGRDVLEDFYGLHLKNRKSLRLPIPRKGYFERVVSQLNSHIIVCYRNGIPLAGALFLEDKNNLYYATGTSSEEGRKLGAVDLYLWELIKYGHSVGKKNLYLGGSAINLKGLRKFKAKWGAVEKKIYQYWYPAKKNYQTEVKQSGIILWDKLPDWMIKKISYFVIKWFY